MFIRQMFTRKMLPLFLLSIIAVGVTIRLGIWQLDRLEQRREFNARVNSQIEQPELVLNNETVYEDISGMEYRQVKVIGEYDHSQEVAIRNQHWENQWGVHLVTPLIIEGTDVAILVDRGWIPAEDYESGAWDKYSEPGRVEVNGVIRASKYKADFGGRTDPTPIPGNEKKVTWDFVNVEGISSQITFSLLNGYIQQAPEDAWVDLPYRSQPKLDLTEGPHQGYAIQWFTFAVIAAVGFPLYVYLRNKKPENKVRSLNETRMEGANDPEIVN